MPDLDAVVRDLMKDVGATLRPLGFRGSGGLWRLATAEGVAVVQKQGSQGSWYAEKLFYVNTSIVLTAWWEWNHACGDQPRPLERVAEYDGLRLLEGRVPSSDPRHYGAGPDRWRVTADTDLDRFRDDLLAAVAASAGRLVELLEPGRYLDELLALPTRGIGVWEALVVLLAERGPSPDLDAACIGLIDAYADRDANPDHLLTWATDRASR